MRRGPPTAESIAIIYVIYNDEGVVIHMRPARRYRKIRKGEIAYQNSPGEKRINVKGINSQGGKEGSLLRRNG